MGRKLPGAARTNRTIGSCKKADPLGKYLEVPPTFLSPSATAPPHTRSLCYVATPPVVLLLISCHPRPRAAPRPLPSPIRKVSRQSLPSNFFTGGEKHPTLTLSYAARPYSFCPQRTPAREHRPALDATLLPDQPARQTTRRGRHPGPDPGRAQDTRPRQPHRPRLAGPRVALQQGRARVLAERDQGSATHTTFAQGLRLGKR